MSEAGHSENDGWQAVTAAHIIGIFVAIQICLLTQPSGSLFNIRTGGLLWRCNPLGALLEALIIIRYILWPVREATSNYKRSRDLARQDLEGGEQIPSRYELKHIVIALLYLRANLSETTNVTKLDASSVPKRGVASVELQSTADTLDQSFEPTQIPRSQDGERKNIHSQSPSDVLEAHHVATSTQNQAVQTFDSSVSLSGAKGPFDVTEHITMQDWNRALDTTRYQEWRPSIINSLGFISAAVKLFAIQGATLFKVLVMPSILGWVVLQCLLVTSYSATMKFEDRQKSRKLAESVGTRLRKESVWWNTTYTLIHLPLIGYYTILTISPAQWRTTTQPTSPGVNAFCNIFDYGLTARQIYTLRYFFPYFTSLFKRSRPESNDTTKKSQLNLQLKNKSRFDFFRRLVPSGIAFGVFLHVVSMFARTMHKTTTTNQFLSDHEAMFKSYTETLQRCGVRSEDVMDTTKWSYAGFENESCDQTKLLTLVRDINSLRARTKEFLRVGKIEIVEKVVINMFMVVQGVQIETFENWNFKGSKWDHSRLSSSNVILSMMTVVCYLLIHDESRSLRPAWTTWLV